MPAYERLDTVGTYEKPQEIPAEVNSWLLDYRRRQDRIRKARVREYSLGSVLPREVRDELIRRSLEQTS